MDYFLYTIEDFHICLQYTSSDNKNNVLIEALRPESSYTIILFITRSKTLQLHLTNQTKACEICSLNVLWIQICYIQTTTTLSQLLQQMTTIDRLTILTRFLFLSILDSSQPACFFYFWDSPLRLTKVGMLL